MGQFRALCGVLERPELAEPPHAPEGLSSNVFLTVMAGAALREGLAEAFARREARVLEDRLAAEGAPAARVRNLQEVLTEIYSETPGIGVPGAAVGFGPGCRWLNEPDQTRPLGEHNDELLGRGPDL